MTSIVQAENNGMDLGTLSTIIAEYEHAILHFNVPEWKNIPTNSGANIYYEIWSDSNRTTIVAESTTHSIIVSNAAAPSLAALPTIISNTA